MRPLRLPGNREADPDFRQETVNESGEIGRHWPANRMKDLVADMKNRYPEEVYVFDVPPILTGADALAFVPLVVAS